MLRETLNEKFAIHTSQSFIESIQAEHNQYSDYLKILDSAIKQRYLDYFQKTGQKSDETIEKIRVFYDSQNIAIDYMTSNPFFPPVQVHSDYKNACNFYMEKIQGKYSSISKIVKDDTDDALLANTKKLAVELRDFKGINPSIAEFSLYGNSIYIIKPLPINTRIQNQQGVFLFSKKINEPEYVTDDFEEKGIIVSSIDDDHNKFGESEILRIDIPDKYAEAIHKELDLYGISREFIYPELNTFAEEMPKRVLQDLVPDEFDLGDG